MNFVNRHVAKTISWRVVGTADTMILSWVITGSWEAGMQIGLADVSTKMLLYYIHERAWFKSSVSNANKRHLLKTITWRIVGTADTVILAWVIWGNGMQSVQIGGAETVTKSLLYFVHEKIWYRFSFGRNTRKRNEQNEATQ